MFINYYEILGIDSNATEEQIKKAYRLNAIKYHPDKNFGDPYFAKTFIAIKDAYDNLIDPLKRAEFDIAYKQRFAKTTSATNDTHQEQQAKQEYQRQEQQERQQRTERKKQEEEKFRYDPHKQFYSTYDRELQETPQFPPNRTPWGDTLTEVFDFFKLPKKIGKIICGYSSLTKSMQPKTFVSVFIDSLKKSIPGMIFLAIPLLLIYAHWYFNLHQKSITGLSIFFAIVSILIIRFNYSVNSNLVDFNHYNYYLGINGFAFFKFQGNRENITQNTEVNFNEITDLVSFEIRKKHNFNYVHTEYLFLWININSGKIIYSKNDTYRDEKNELEMVLRYTSPELIFNREAEKYWTIYLLDKMESELDKNGFINFNTYSPENKSYYQFIKLGIGQITFIKGRNEEFTYKFNDIKKMYTKGSELRVQHKNFERTLYFFKSGNEDVIPLTNLCNRQFFFKAIEILLGYSIG